MMTFFDDKIAKEYGVEYAILLNNIGTEVLDKTRLKLDMTNGRAWTSTPINVYEAFHPYWTRRKIKDGFKKLLKEGLIITRVDKGMDVYTLSDKGLKLF